MRRKMRKSYKKLKRLGKKIQVFLFAKKLSPLLETIVNALHIRHQLSCSFDWPLSLALMMTPEDRQGRAGQQGPPAVLSI
jgi:hypothetical protein